MTYNYLLLLVDYNYWARDRILEAVASIPNEDFIRTMNSSFGSVRDTLAHICTAEHVWVARLKREEPKNVPTPDLFPDVHSVRVRWAELESDVRQQLQWIGPAGVEQTIEYEDLRGNKQSDAVWEMLQHMVNHASYHRGQITTMLRQLSGTGPRSMDLITFYRESRCAD